MTTQESPFVTDRDTQAAPDFNRDDRITKITGTLQDFHVREPNRAGTRARAKFVLRDITHVERASDAAVNAASFTNGFTVSYDYGEWDAINKIAKAPKKNDLWFEAVVPTFKANGVDLGSGEALYAMIGEEITFVEMRVERIGYEGKPYEVRKRDVETGYTLPPIVVDDSGNPVLDSEGNNTFMEKDEEAERWYPEDATYLRETAWFEGLFPVMETAEAATSGDPRVRASELLANADGDYDKFKTLAAQDPVISTDNALRNEILTGSFTAA